MSEISLRERLMKYFRVRPDELIPSGHLQRLVATETFYTPSNCSRRLRELQEEGFLEVEYIKNHAHYRLKIMQLSLV